jgi:hypothetical protein
MHNSLTRRFVLALVLATLSGTIAHACDDNPSSNSPNRDGNRSSADIAECRDSHPDSAPNAPVTYFREGCYLVARVGDLECLLQISISCSGLLDSTQLPNHSDRLTTPDDANSDRVILPS